jgi:DDE superfamily endonuclease
LELTNYYTRPCDYKELYNFQHSQAQNVVEWIFGVVKCRYLLMTSGPEYSLHTQFQIILTICILHNFIHVHDPDDLDLESFYDWDKEMNYRPCHYGPESYRYYVSQAESDQATSFHDKIAKAK